MTTIRKILKWTVPLAGISLLASWGYLYYSLVTGEDRVTAFCNEMTPGMSRDELIRLAKQQGLGPSMTGPDVKVAYLAERRSFGRHVCRVELDSGVVKAASYRFFD